jgi:tripartite-type tricarboxylate transporter receptor subunit TctC
MKKFLVSCFASVIALAMGASLAQPFPGKPMRIIAPYAPGGGLDAVARIVALGMSEKLGQSVVVENRAGAGGMIGAELVAKAPPDGYTLMMAGNSEIVVNPSLHANVKYDVQKDFAPLVMIGTSPNVLVASSANTRSLQALLSTASTQPVTIGTTGLGTVHHLAVEVIKAGAKAEVVHTPYRGAGPAVTDVMGGQVVMSLVGLPAVSSHIRAGKLQALAVTQSARSGVAPGIPTVEEATGIKGLDAFSVWFGLIAPSQVPAPIRNQLEQTAQEVLKDPATRAKLAGLGVDVTATPSADFANRIRSESRRFAEVIQRFNVKPE